MFEMLSLVELLRVRLVASLNLCSPPGATRRYVFVGNAEIGKMPGELFRMKSRYRSESSE